MFWLHFLDGGRNHRGSVIAITESETPPVVEINIGGSKLVNITNGKPETLDPGWKLGPLPNIHVAKQYAKAIANEGNYDVMVDGKPMGLPYAPAIELGRRGGQSTSEAKKRSSRENGRKGGRPRKEN